MGTGYCSRMPTPAFLHPFAPTGRTDFIRIVGGEGAEVWDDAGNRYVDGMASLWYMNIGYGRREMADAIAAQAVALAAFHAFDPFSNEPAERLADLLVELSPFDAARVFLGVSGSDAVDTAMKLARLAQREAGHPERTLIVSRDRGYHGTNYGGTSAQGITPNREGWGPLVGEVVQVPADDIEAMARLFADRGGEVAAVLVEPVQGAGGVYPPVDGYLQGVRRLCDDHGAYLVLDEVITGFGRLGHWFAAQRYGVRPDMITFAKAVTSGYVPLGGVIVGPAVREPLEADGDLLLRHGYTYSGHPVAAAAAMTAIEIQRREDLLGRVPGIGKRLADGLGALAADGLVDEARGEGGVWAVELPEERSATEARDAALAQGVIFRPLGNALAMCPPLVVTDAQLDRMVDVLAAVTAPNPM